MYLLAALGLVTCRTFDLHSSTWDLLVSAFVLPIAAWGT